MKKKRVFFPRLVYHSSVIIFLRMLGQALVFPSIFICSFSFTTKGIQDKIHACTTNSSSLESPNVPTWPLNFCTLPWLLLIIFTPTNPTHYHFFKPHPGQLPRHHGNLLFFPKKIENTEPRALVPSPQLYP